ncbi:MAG: hypothetical protein D6730_20965 [Bacteroidetes bacterium]|nr:MAG: hypothetical protein D6730_20965 [Bacteroidota bacterium]
MVGHGSYKAIGAYGIGRKGRVAVKPFALLFIVGVIIKNKGGIVEEVAVPHKVVASIAKIARQADLAQQAACIGIGHQNKGRRIGAFPAQHQLVKIAIPLLIGIVIHSAVAHRKKTAIPE